MVTFRSLESPRQEDIEEVAKPREAMWPLEIWYESTRDKPLAELSINDLAVACRQKIHIDHFVPHALKALVADPLAGDQGNGELAVALKGLPTEYWLKHPDEASAFLTLARRSYETTLTWEDDPPGDEDLNFDLPDLMGQQIEPEVAPSATVTQFGTSQTVGALQVFHLTTSEMNRFASLLAVAVRDRKGLAVSLGEIHIQFLYGSNSGTADFVDASTIIFWSNLRDMRRLATELLNAYAQPDAVRQVHFAPRYLIPNASVADIVFQLRQR